MSKVHRLLTAIELRSFMRQPISLFWTFLYPIVLTIVLAMTFGATPEEETLLVAVSASDRADLQQRISSLEASLTASGIAVELTDEADGADLTLQREPSGTIIARSLSDKWQSRQLALELRAQGSTTPVAFIPSGGPSSNYRVYLIAGVAALSVITMALFGFTAVIVANRSAGRLRWLAFWPVRPIDFLVGFIASRLLITVAFSLVLIYGFGWYFGAEAIWRPLVAFQMTLCIVVGAFCFLAFGLLLASFIFDPSTSNAIVNLLNLPLLFLSDFIVPLSVLPDWLATIASYLPTTIFVHTLRSLVESGEISDLFLVTNAGLLAVGIVCLWLAARYFKVAKR